jgi:hypothetical protein
MRLQTSGSRSTCNNRTALAAAVELLNLLPMPQMSKTIEFYRTLQKQERTNPWSSKPLAPEGSLHNLSKPDWLSPGRAIEKFRTKGAGSQKARNDRILSNFTKIKNPPAIVGEIRGQHVCCRSTEGVESEINPCCDRAGRQSGTGEKYSIVWNSAHRDSGERFIYPASSIRLPYLLEIPPIRRDCLFLGPVFSWSGIVHLEF